MDRERLAELVENVRSATKKRLEALRAWGDASDHVADLNQGVDLAALHEHEANYELMKFIRESAGVFSEPPRLRSNEPAEIGPGTIIRLREGAE